MVYDHYVVNANQIIQGDAFLLSAPMGVYEHRSDGQCIVFARSFPSHTLFIVLSVFKFHGNLTPDSLTFTVLTHEGVFNASMSEWRDVNVIHS